MLQELGVSPDPCRIYWETRDRYRKGMDKTSGLPRAGATPPPLLVHSRSLDRRQP